MINDIRSVAATNIFVSALISPQDIKIPEKISCVVPDWLGAQIKASGVPINRAAVRQNLAPKPPFPKMQGVSDQYIAVYM